MLSLEKEYLANKERYAAMKEEAARERMMRSNPMSPRPAISILCARLGICLGSLMVRWGTRLQASATPLPPALSNRG